MRAAQAWDVFCRVIDNHGDLGVAWRLCADLAARGQRVRLWADDVSALAWMAPGGQPGVEVVAWTNPAPDLAPGDVVVGTFGCDPPERFVQHMAALASPPVWINLEYLSAEPYVERSHGLPSPVNAGHDRALTKRFFYPGFTPRTGGLLREPGLLGAQRTFDRERWLDGVGASAQHGERVVSLFCYDNPALADMLDALGDSPTLLLATPGAAAAQVGQLLGAGLRRGAVRALKLPHLTQRDYDRLLWACDLNFVRGEDSFVRAQWAGKPFVWQIYPQPDNVHGIKLRAFLDRMLTGTDHAIAAPLRSLWLGWNCLPLQPAVLPDYAPWCNLCQRWRETLLAQPDLTTQLLGFVGEMR
jgi:uncharacterized repeat protein (TIGR03837 family)